MNAKSLKKTTSVLGCHLGWNLDGLKGCSQLIYSLSNNDNSDDLEWSSRSFTYCKLFQVWFFVQTCSIWQDFNYHSASRSPSSAIAKLIVDYSCWQNRMPVGRFLNSIVKAHFLAWLRLFPGNAVKVRSHRTSCVAVRHFAVYCVVFAAYRKTPQRTASGVNEPLEILVGLNTFYFVVQNFDQRFNSNYGPT